MTKRYAYITLLLAAATCWSACDSSKTTVIPQAPQATVGNELAAMARLRAIGSAEMSYSATNNGKYATLDELIRGGMVNDPSQGKLTGYTFDVRVTEHGFEARATPEKYGISGKRSFYVDEQNSMRGTDKNGSPAGASDPIL